MIGLLSGRLKFWLRSYIYIYFIFLILLVYIGSTENSFKERYYGHKASMRDAKYRNSTTLSHYYWDCKDKGETPHIQWEILRTCKTYRPGTRKCDICLTEKMLILRERGPHSLNKRSELMYKCPHRSKWKLLNVKWMSEIAECRMNELTELVLFSYLDNDIIGTLLIMTS